MLMRFLILFLVVLSNFVLGGNTLVDELQKLVVPLGKPSALLKAVEANLAAALAEAVPHARMKQQSLVTKDELVILYGDLFKNGGCFAIFQVQAKSEDHPDYQDGGFALAEWTKAGWQLRGLWNIPAIWRPKGWKPQDDDYLPVSPATQPFELNDLSGDGVPELIVAGEVDKYFQAHYLLRFEPKTHGLHLLEWAMGKPERAGKYVRLYSNSGRRAIFEEWRYMVWSRGRLMQRASWHDEVPYNDVDGSFVLAEVNSDLGEQRSFRIAPGESSSENESAYTITEGDRHYADVVFVWKKSKLKNQDNRCSALQSSWLFEKITGLPRNLYPVVESPKNVSHLEAHATVRVTGGKDALQRFGSSRHR
jgi:hypothetical protein